MSEPSKEAFKEFSLKLFARAFEGYDMDGAEIQELGHKLGLLEIRKVNPDENEWEADELYFPTFTLKDGVS